MNRKVARDYLFKLVFSYTFNKERDNAMLIEFAADQQLSDDDRMFMADTYDGVIEHYDELRDIIAGLSIGFNIDRVFRPDLAIMLIAVYEMKYNPSVPAPVAIAEAVAIIKIYSTTKSYSFVNGVLAGYYRQLKEEQAQ